GEPAAVIDSLQECDIVGAVGTTSLPGPVRLAALREDKAGHQALGNPGVGVRQSSCAKPVTGLGSSQLQLGDPGIDPFVAAEGAQGVAHQLGFEGDHCQGRQLTEVVRLRPDGACCGCHEVPPRATEPRTTLIPEPGGLRFFSACPTRPAC